MGVRHIDTNKCIACGKCAAMCPEDVIRMSKTTGKPVIQYLHDCQSCFICELNCPAGAIFVSPLRERRQILPW